MASRRDSCLRFGKPLHEAGARTASDGRFPAGGAALGATDP